MKLSGLALVASIALGGIAATPVAADTVVKRTVVTSHTESHEGMQMHHRKKVCRTYWRHHQKVTRCWWRNWR